MQRLESIVDREREGVKSGEPCIDLDATAVSRFVIIYQAGPRHARDVGIPTSVAVLIMTIVRFLVLGRLIVKIHL